MNYLMPEIWDTEAISLEQDKIDSISNLCLSKAYFNNSERTKQ